MNEHELYVTLEYHMRAERVAAWLGVAAGALLASIGWGIILAVILL